MRAAIMKQEAHTSNTDKYKTRRLFTITQIPLMSNTKRLVMLHQSHYMLLHAFFWVIPWCLHFIRQRFGKLCLSHLHRRPTKMEQTVCSKTLAYKIQMLGNYPEENIQHSEHSKSFEIKITCYQQIRKGRPQ